ncbi:hypothetical protein AYL99_02932 [Fonsecaea erecta]|uniref:Uncharacterized protein n=1 Tax=Fonsecaea erecta TaxID=1367422 RepID=A0A178ZXI3_9EURO|nr:hypothetical protein AYL99_02932 [Fonsecaea erecta]OAP63705.1 hypothetical protein AYL99_02932 [Fonsecaea erecta]
MDANVNPTQILGRERVLSQTSSTSRHTDLIADGENQHAPTPEDILSMRLDPASPAYRDPRCLEKRDTQTPRSMSPADNAILEASDQESELKPYLAREDVVELVAATDQEASGTIPSQTSASATDKGILKPTLSWATVPVLVLAMYATVFSGIFLCIALIRPRWGHRIGTTGGLPISSATFISALLSKTVELAFVTVFVAVLGQILTRRAFLHFGDLGGISIAEMSMRTWIMQPGTLITNWQGVRYAGKTLLGGVVFAAVIAATLYTTAAEALVAPKLKLGPVERKLLFGKVMATYANIQYFDSLCLSAVTDIYEGPDGLEQVPCGVDGDLECQYNYTCVLTTYNAESLNNYRMFAANWSTWGQSNHQQTASYENRPIPITTMYDRTNTTIMGQFITPGRENITADSERHGRLVQNLTIAMPHLNVLNAVQDARNHIIQPADLVGSEYLIEASVPAPTLNVVCVGLSRSEVLPLVVNMSDVPADQQATFVNPNPTAVDEIFSWANAFENNDNPPTLPRPYFPRIPNEFDTVSYVPPIYGPPAVYILVTPPRFTVTNDHVVCSIQSAQYWNCTTSYRAALGAGDLSVYCDADSRNTIPYGASAPNAGPYQPEQDWKDVGADWLTAIGLADGAKVNSNLTTLARIVNQFSPRFVAGEPTYLPSNRPSIAEALGVLAMGTLARMSINSPFLNFWNYSIAILEEPQYQNFHARHTFVDYSSSASQPWQNLFYVVLFLVFVLSAASTAYLYLTMHSGIVTDYTEPQALFAVAINSPPSAVMAGTSVGGPRGEVLGKKWLIEMHESEARRGGDDGDEASSSPSAHADQVSNHADRQGCPHLFLRCKEAEEGGQGEDRDGEEVEKEQEEEEVLPRKRRFGTLPLRTSWTSIASGWHHPPGTARLPKASTVAEQYRRLARVE